MQHYRPIKTSIDYNYKPPQPHDARRGVIPHIETPQEKMARLRAKGFNIPLPAHQDTRPELPFAAYDLGNKELPAFKHKTEILNTIEENRITLLTGPTGCGKTTQLAQFALEAGYERVVVLLPRRINVDNNGERIEDELAEQLGRERASRLVGMAHSERTTIRDESTIQLMTSGTFIKKLPDAAEKWVDEKVLIIADEIHENNLETEFAAAHAVRQVEENDSWRVVFASATPDKATLTKSYQAINGAEVPVVEIEGRPHELAYMEEPEMDIVQAYHAHNAGEQKTLMFVDGKRSIDEAISELKRSMSQDERERTRFFKLHAKISDRAREAIFSMELDPGEKAIIVSTSAGQSGITIEGLGLVITSGLTKSPELDQEGAPGLPPRLCTQAEIVQQGGRAGRDVSGGRCVLARPLYYNARRNTDNELYQFTPLEERLPDMPPEIYHSNVSRNILAATAMEEDFFEFNDYLKNSVRQKTIQDSYELLYNLGAVDDDYRITDLGRTMDMFPLRPELSRAAAEVIHSRKLSIQAYTLAIASAIEAGGLANFDSGQGKWKQYLRRTTDDDFIAQLDLMLASREYFRGTSVDEEELTRMGLDAKNVYRAHRQFDKMCRMIGLEARDIDLPESTPDEEDELRSIFLSGMPELLYEKVATVRRKGQYNNIWGYDEGVRREVSDRSLLAMGQTATKLVAGYPRWYVDSQGRRHDIIETGFATSKEQVRVVLGHLASQELFSDIRGGQLIKSGHNKLGSLSLGDVGAFNAKTQTEYERRQLIEMTLRAGTPAVTMLREMGVPRETLWEECSRAADNAGSVDELDSRLWGVVAKYQSMNPVPMDRVR